MKRIRAVARNAIIWAAGWAAVPTTVFTTLKLIGIIPDSVSWKIGFSLAARFGFIGFVAGTIFSTVVGFAYRGRRLAEINWVKFGLAGGAITAVAVPLFLQMMNLLADGHIIAWHLVLDDSLWTGGLGAVIAGGSLKFAQRSLASHAEHDEPERIGSDA